MQLSPSELALPHALAAAGAQLPSSASIHMPCAVRGCSRNSGYIPATALEALLLRFLGGRGSAALAAAAARFRSQPAPQAPLSVPPGNPAPTGAAATASSSSSSNSNRSSNNCHNPSNSCRYHDNSRRGSGRASSSGRTRSTGDDSPPSRRTAGPRWRPGRQQQQKQQQQQQQQQQQHQQQPRQQLASAEAGRVVPASVGMAVSQAPA